MNDVPLQVRWEVWVVDAEALLQRWNPEFPTVPRPLPPVDHPAATQITEALLVALEVARDSLE